MGNHFAGKDIIFRIFRPCMAIFLAILATFLATTVQAAALYGSVQANFGWGYVGVDNGTPAQPGVSVIANPGASGQIVYENGCTVEVLEGQVEVVQTEPPCTAGAWHHGPHHWAFYTLAGAAIIGGLAFLFNDDDKPVSP